MRSQGFSLVELSIVLVILGLLTGGILTGQNLIRAAELRSVTTEFQTYQTAIMTFRDKYFALPGDMRNATDFWGSAGGSGTLGDGCEAATGTGTQTCNGDGNGRAGIPEDVGQYGESFMLWQHLANANLISGSYTGKAGSGGKLDSAPGVNMPLSKMSGTGWGVYWWNLKGINNPNWFAYDYETMFVFGALKTAGLPENPVLTPAEAWGIDKKIDDGKPGTGNLMSRLWDTCTNAATNGYLTDADRKSAEYLLSDNTPQCALLFQNILNY